LRRCDALRRVTPRGQRGARAWRQARQRRSVRFARGAAAARNNHERREMSRGSRRCCVLFAPSPLRIEAVNGSGDEKRGGALPHTGHTVRWASQPRRF
jgi:hypothetical protein